MFEIRQTNPELPLHISVHYDIDRFIKVYIWIILILLKNGPQSNFELVESVESVKEVELVESDKISVTFTQTVSVFLEERLKRNEALIKLETDEEQCLLQFLKKRGIDLTTIHTDCPVRCFNECGNIYTKIPRGLHICIDGTKHYKSKGSLFVLRPTNCCLNCEGKFFAYMECGHIVCEAHIDPNKSSRANCPKCSTNAFKIKLNF